jgi:hypothetical protein
METMTIFETLTKISCGNCGGVYAIGERYRQHQYECGKSWHCPYCETGWGYSGNGEIDALKREKQRLENQLSSTRSDRDYHRKEAEHFRKSRDAVKGVVTKIKKRVGRGVCPCCNRTFQDLQRHMLTNHPKYHESP